LGNLLEVADTQGPPAGIACPEDGRHPDHGDHADHHQKAEEVVQGKTAPRGSHGNPLLPINSSVPVT
jgi:hypothetical protein